MKKTRQKTLKALATDLHDVYDEVRAGKMDEVTANTLTNVADKIINSAKARLKYKSFNGTIGKIDELE